MKPEARSNISMVAAADPDEPLPYRVELRDSHGAPERIIGRAASIVLARAIFAAAHSDFANARIALCKGAEVLLESDPPH